MANRRNENFKSIKDILEEEGLEDIGFFYPGDNMEDFENK